MNKLKMETPDITDKNIEQIAKLFPNVITETQDKEGNTKKAVDFDLLKQTLSDVLVEDENERYRLDWPGKKASLLKANTPISKTLRPVIEDSVDFENTENLYIEGDNFEVLKILQESYLGKIKMIYIDPPYNTGNDFIYKDDFKVSNEEYDEAIGASDEEGSKLFKNTDSNGRFHSDWLSMMQERLIIAKDILKDDGIIFISIDDNEVKNLLQICNEILGEENFIAQFVWIKKKKGSHLSKTVRSMTEYVLAYTKNQNSIELYGEDAYSDKQQPLAKRTNSKKILKFPKLTVKTKLEDGSFSEGTYGEGSSSIEFLEPFEVKNGIVLTELIVNGPFVWTQPKLNEELSLGTEINLSSRYGFNVLRSDQETKIKRPSTIIDSKVNVGTNEDAYEEAIEMFGKEGIMSYPKPTSLIKFLTNTITYFDKDSIIMDFFSGSATTAHALMQLNAEDGGNRKFIMIQLPEKTDEYSEAYKAGYKSISEIGKERIRRAGKRIKEEETAKAQAELDKIKKQMEESGFIENDELQETKKELEAKIEHIKNLDTGFRVYKTDSTNMKDVFYHPSEIKQEQLDFAKSNIKEDRTPEDLLTQVILDLGLELSLLIEKKEILGNTIFVVQENALIACFDDDIDFGIVDKIADINPFKVVFKDASFKDDKDRINVEERFKELSPETVIKVI